MFTSERKHDQILGIDIGGSSIKATVVNTITGELLRSVFSLPHSVQPTPDEIISNITDVLTQFSWDGPVGCGYPGVVLDGRAFSAVHLSDAWLEIDLKALLKTVCRSELAVINDADAAGLAEMTFGAGRGVDGTVLLVTLGTGIGSALFIDGALVPNTEFGHIWLADGREAEDVASASARVRDNLDWSEWGGRLNEYLTYMNKLLSPRLIVIGGGISEKFDSFRSYLDHNLPVVPATLANNAGLIGAALACSHGISL